MTTPRERAFDFDGVAVFAQDDWWWVLTPPGLYPFDYNDSA